MLADCQNQDFTGLKDFQDFSFVAYPVRLRLIHAQETKTVSYATRDDMGLSESGFTRLKDFQVYDAN